MLKKVAELKLNKNKDYYKETVKALEKAGFIIKSKTDYNFSLCAVPSRCGEMNVKSFLSTLLSDVINYNSVKSLNIFNHIVKHIWVFSYICKRRYRSTKAGYQRKN